MLPVYYKGQTKACMTRELFLDCFQTELVLAVRRAMRKIGLPEKALLLLDNALGHPNADDMVSDGLQV